ncbi:Zinc knuckle CX2CX4HX4C [Trema orientale]|uniref:Zinc knuckle CX2CX4HX4C n=1 Tax=Trema orientale TaxID=63057 RepID=A0A2P5EZG9_TREOI|nr:Zinc knuckle CX2CX4HX4C [Trema orientale]
MEEDDFTDVDLLVSHTSNLHCFDEPLELLTNDDSHNESQLVLAVGKLLSFKPHSANFIKTIVSQMWGITKGLKITELEKNKFTIVFPNAREKVRILGKSPWTINREIFIVKEVPPNLSVREVNFVSITFWVRFMGLPRDSISEANVRLIVARIGKLIEIDRRSLGVFFPGDFVRAKVEMLVFKPFVAGFFQKRKRGNPRWIQFKYERLQDFCFKCGTLGHDHRLWRKIQGDSESLGDSRTIALGENSLHRSLQTDRRRSEKGRLDDSVPETCDVLRLAVTVNTISSAMFATEGGLNLQRRSFTNGETSVMEIQMVETNESGQGPRQFDRKQRKGAAKYGGTFPDILIDRCYHPEEYFNDILEEMMSPCEVDQYRAHQALLTPAPTMEEWRAQRGLSLEGPIMPSLKRKAQSFILPIAHPSDMPQWPTKLDVAKLAQSVAAIQSGSAVDTQAESAAHQSPLPISPAQFSHGSYSLGSTSSSRGRWKQRARAKGRLNRERITEGVPIDGSPLAEVDSLVFRLGAMETGPKVSPPSP